MKRAILLSTLLISTTTFAGGYRVSLQGQKALGMGHVGVSMSDSSEVVFFNPAGMTQLSSDLAITGGFTLVDSKVAYQNTTTNSSAETSNPTGIPVNFYLTKKYSDKLSFGFGVYTPYGNTVEYPTDWVGSHLVNNITLKALYLQPTIAYQITEQYSIGFGPTFVNGEVEFNRNLSSALVDANGNRSNLTISDSGITATGYNIGFFAKQNDALTWGVSYRSQVDMRARGGIADFENIPSSQQSVFSDTTFNADLVLPAEFNLGVSYKISDDTTLAFEMNRAYWNEYKTLTVDFANSAPTSVNARNYKDADTFRFGLQSQYNNDLILRTGVYLDKTPVQDGFFAPETPRNDAIGYTLGASYLFNKQLELDFSLLILKFRETAASYDHIINSDGSTSSFAGSYKSSVVTVGFGVNYLF
jgi:long-chain fatty acid transport protein